jgi:hypothetical protein
MLDKTKLKGVVEISIRDGKGRLKSIWQEYAIFHYLRKNFGINFPKFFGITGYYTKHVKYTNLVTNAGRALITNLIYDISTPTAPSYIGIGTGTTAAAATDTTLETEESGAGLNRAAATITSQTTTVSGDTGQSAITFTYTGGSDKAITEMGLFNAASGGTMVARTVFPVYTLQTNDQFTITHKLVNA